MRSLPYEHVSKVGVRLKITQAVMSVFEVFLQGTGTPVLDLADKVHQTVLQSHC